MVQAPCHQTAKTFKSKWPIYDSNNLSVCVCVCVHVYVVYEDTNLYNDIGMT